MTYLRKLSNQSAAFGARGTWYGSKLRSSGTTSSLASPLAMVFLPPSSPDNEWDSDEEDGIADQEPLDVSWIPVNAFHVAICSLPGRRCAGVKRSLVADLETLKKCGVEDVFVLCTEAELRRCHVPTLLVDYVERGMHSYHHPLEDDHLSLAQCLPMLKELHSSLLRGRKTAIHCTNGFGRSCLAVVLLAMLLDGDLPPMVAMEIVQRARGPAAIQTIKQYNFVMDFRKNLADIGGLPEPQQPVPRFPPPSSVTAAAFS